MARIRSIHPGLLTDEAFMALTVQAPLAIPLLLGLLMEADDAGAFPWKPMVIKARVLPAVPEDVGQLLGELVRAGFVMKYEIEGREYGAVRNFMRWQRPKKPKYIHPMTEQVRSYVGSGSEPVPHDGETGSEISSQREEGGGKREEKEEPASAASSAGAARETSMPRADYDRIETSLRTAAGLTDDPSPGLMVLAPILGLLDGGASLEADILPVLRAKASAGKRGRSWAFYVDAIREAMRARSGAAANVVPISAAPSRETPRDVWAIWVEGFKRKRSWLHALGPKPDEVGCRAPPDILAEHGFEVIAAKETA